LPWNACSTAATLPPMPLFTIDTYRELKPHDQQEWLLTNGLGGFASSTVAGMNTRRYHGLLCAATLPPVGRVMTVNRIGEVLLLDDKSYELSITTCRGGLLHPRGDHHLEKFELNDVARWEFDVDGVRIVKQVQLLWGQNVTAVRYEIDSGNRPFKLSLLPFCSLRDFHALRRAEGSFFRADSKGRQVTVQEGSHGVVVTADAGDFQPAWNYWYDNIYPCDTERGQDDCEDLYTPGAFVLEATGKSSITLWMSLEPMTPGDWEGELKKRRDAIEAACHDPENVSAGMKRESCLPKSDQDKKLYRAANDFIVFRKNPDGKPGTTVIAGYPWFADWGRDTMISLPGLLLVPGRFHQAREVLTVFAKYVSEGMIPNRFDDYTNEPEYNTVDASLWFIHAVFEYARLSKDQKTFQAVLLPACQSIVEGYSAGTRYHIKMDPADGLISQGDAQTQLTWMDAKCGDIAFTPRQGKPVEINALWYHALVLLGRKELAAKVAVSFRKAFWISSEEGLADVLDGNRQDKAIRPNQIFAVSLPNSPLLPEQQSAVVEVVRRELLTPVGLRTLARTDPGYRGKYTGDQFHRDGAYHNGTVWPWLLGAFLEAYIKVNDRTAAAVAQAQEWLEPLLTHMHDEAEIGQIAEIFEGDAPHRPVGCFAQAWSVAEVLRIHVMLNGTRSDR
jgi:predicted glycogen debranching enzyme